MGKGLRVWLGEEGEGVRPNRPVEGDDLWKGVGEVGMQVDGRSGGVIRSYSGGLFSSTI